MSERTPIVQVNGPDEFLQIHEVSRETLDRLLIYEKLLRKWQKAINLVAPSTLDTLWQRHFADSAQFFDLAKAIGGNWIDLGSGAGFPGLVLAILRAGEPVSGPGTQRTTLIESDLRKCAFLREVARETGTIVDIVSCRIELFPTQSKVAQGDLVTARALARLDRLLGLAAPYFGPATVGLFAKGRGAATEIEEARAGWSFKHRLHPSQTDCEGRIVEIRDLKSKA